MKRRWLPALACFCTWIAVIEANAVPTQTQDTMVIAKSDNGPTDPSTNVSSHETATAEPVPPVKLTEMEVTSDIALRYAHTAVVTRVRNPAKRSQEATFKILLPDTAFISGFIMTLDGKSYKAYVKEKEEAKNIYNQAVASGTAAAHIAAKARDSNHFTVTVNVEPNTEAVFNLTYEELLVRRNGVYNHAINLHPGSLVPNLSVTVNIHESEKITKLRVPEVRTGNEIDATAEDTQNSKAVIHHPHDDRLATVTFKPDLEEQRRLIGIYMEKSKESQSNMRSFYNPVEPDVEEKNEGVLGQFVVQYDVDRPKNGEIIVNNGYFVHFFAPSNLPPLNKHVVFVLDTSGSMSDRKIVQLREAMETILSDLNRGDYFNIVEFDSSVTVHELKEADEEPARPLYHYYRTSYVPKVKLVAPSPATEENKAKATVIVNRLEASGGTNIGQALDIAVQIVKKGLSTNNEAHDDFVENNPDIETDSVSAPHTESTTLPTTVASELSKPENEAVKLEPIIIFLTDGDPTVGETNPTKIINHLTEKNYGVNKAAIFSLAFGQDADRKFLRKISLRNDGFMRHIYEAADAAQQLRDFYRQVSSPLLAHLKFIYPPNQVKSDSLTKHSFRSYYDGSEVVVAGQVDETATEIVSSLNAYCAVDNQTGSVPYDVTLTAPIPRSKNYYLPLERLWAYLTVKQLLDKKDAQLDSEKSEAKEKTPEKEALNIALKYQLVTPLTSLVVVKPNDTKNAVNAESVDKVANDNHGFAHGLAGFIRDTALAPLSTNIGGAHHHMYVGSYPVPQASYASAILPGSSLTRDNGVVEMQVDPTLAHAAGPLQYDDVESLDYEVEQASPGYRSTIPTLPSWQMSKRVPDYHTTSLISPRGSTGPINHSSDHMQPDYYITTPRVVTSSISPLNKYGLERYSWAIHLLNTTTDSLVVEVNGIALNLKLIKDNRIPLIPGGDPVCNNAIDGATGNCIYITSCVAAQNITVENYSKSACIFDSGYAGVCCPEDRNANISA
ncbi:inter-alpha-trypsin inhibitor heavy chain H4-like [Achroia grisella]|uniref:inter-alpha-trypsin inhibitor heavy chain H4-like n=1 Tax=Achroia grisella TaxID=688607 RepID=UPI0027D2193A|nr:inter-alpha-trypsin inhibitor heavy chain H4-like [Achroia grisella]